MKIHIAKIILNLCLVLWACSAVAQDLELANNYYTQGEYEKAAELYKKLSSNKMSALQIHDNYLNTLYKLKDYDTAEKFLKSSIRANENVLTFKAEYARLLEINGNEKQAKEQFQKLMELTATNDSYYYELQNFFYKHNDIERVVDMTKIVRAKTNDPSKHETFMARAYLFLGDKERMLDEILNFGARTNNLQYIETTIQDNIKTDEEVEMLEKKLFDRIQTFPNETYYSELLIWHYIQKSDFARAFIQTKALDKRLKLEGTKVFELAAICYESGDYKNAAKMYKYIIDEYPNSEYYILARRNYINSKEEVIKNTFPIDINEIKEVLNQYELLIKESGNNHNMLEVYRNMALLNAFYIHDYEKAINLLQKAITSAGNNQFFIDQCKLDLGDIYILKDEPWESTLLYMQVEKSQKENTLGEMAKFKNARLQYYTGQFELSKELLDILKKATTREISNDAMQLSLLIDDNTGLDSTETAMKDFAKVDLLLFQNKYEESITALAELEQKYKTHSLADEILWAKAKTELKLNRIDDAIVDLNIIIKEFSTDILADDALFALAKIYDQNLKEPQKAMELYRKMLKDYPGSIYCAQSRIRYRELRGDYVN